MKPIRLFWWSPVRSPRLLKPELERNLGAWIRLGNATRRPFLNFGDELSPLIVSAVTGRRVEWATPARAELVSVGSVFELAGRYPSCAAVWGTGLRGEPDTAVSAKFLQNLGNVLAVRGPRTRAALSLSSETVLGDPGLLAYMLVSSGRATNKRKVFIPHFTTWNSREGLGLLGKARSQGFEVIEPSRPPIEVIRAVAGASFVISSSLHGVIVAHSLGIPASLLAVGGRAGHEPDWKFKDYFESIEATFSVEPWGVFNDEKLMERSIERASAAKQELQAKAQMLGTKLEAVLGDGS